MSSILAERIKIHALRTEIDKLKSQLRRAEVDANRYRQIRKEWCRKAPEVYSMRGIRLDDDIDFRIKNEPDLSALCYRD